MNMYIRLLKETLGVQDGEDVTKMRIIGRVLTKEDSPYNPSGYLSVVRIVDTPEGQVYVTNQWHKEKKGIPYAVTQANAKEYIPNQVPKIEIKDDPNKEMQNKTLPVTMGLG